ncbi:uncharacterized protein LOC120328590 [Styela clava]
MTKQPQAEYGPVSEDDICNVNYFKTTGTNCNTVKFDFPKEEYCCKPCRDGQENPNPEYSNSCTDIAVQTSTGQSELYTMTPKTFTTTSEIQLPATDGTTTTDLSDDQTTSAVPFLEEITKQVNTTGGEIDIPLVTAPKLDCTTIAVITGSVIVIISVILAIAVYFSKYRKNKQKKKDKKKVLPPTSAANGTNGDQSPPSNQDPALTDDVLMHDLHNEDVESAGETTRLTSPSATTA